MPVKSVHSKNVGGRPRLLLSEAEVDALRLADDRARKARTVEARNRAEADAASFRRLAEIRRDLAGQREAAERAIEVARKREPRKPVIEVYRALWREEAAFPGKIERRWTAIAATGDYAQVLNGTWKMRGAVRAWASDDGSEFALLPARWQKATRTDFINLGEAAMRAKLLAAADQAGMQHDKSLRLVRDAMIEWHFRQRLLEFELEPRAVQSYKHTHQIARIRARHEARSLTPDQVSELERRRVEARGNLPPPIDPKDAKRLLDLDEVARRPLPKSGGQIEAAAQGLRVTEKPGGQFSDQAMRKASFKRLNAPQRKALAEAWRDFLPTWRSGATRKSDDETEYQKLDDAA